MSGATVPTIVAIALQLILGLAVFQANPKRRLNQCFLIFVPSYRRVASFASLRIDGQQTPTVAEFSIRQASVAGALIYGMLNILRLSSRQGIKVGVTF